MIIRDIRYYRLYNKISIKLLDKEKRTKDIKKLNNYKSILFLRHIA